MVVVKYLLLPVFLSNCVSYITRRYLIINFEDLLIKLCYILSKLLISKPYRRIRSFLETLDFVLFQDGIIHYERTLQLHLLTKCYTSMS